MVPSEIKKIYFTYCIEVNTTKIKILNIFFRKKLVPAKFSVLMLYTQVAVVRRYINCFYKKFNRISKGSFKIECACITVCSLVVMISCDSLAMSLH